MPEAGCQRSAIVLMGILIVSCTAVMDILNRDILYRRLFVIDSIHHHAMMCRKCVPEDVVIIAFKLLCQKVADDKTEEAGQGLCRNRICL